MAKILTNAEVLDLSDALKKIHEIVRGMKSDATVAKHIQFPKVPTMLSESIVANSIKEGKLLSGAGQNAEVKLGGRIADILIEYPDGQETRIEVKGTGSKEFITLGNKDYDCDYLVCVKFGNFLGNDETKNIGYFVVSTPRKFFHTEKEYKPTRTNFSSIRNAAKSHKPSRLIEEGEISLSDMEVKRTTPC